jgi:hypothetical protein
MSPFSKKASAALISSAVLLASLPGAVFGQTSSGLPAPGSKEFVQIPNLTVQAIDYVATIQGGPGTGFVNDGLQAVLTVSPTVGTCTRFANETSASPLACSKIAVQQYSVQVTGRTTIMDRARKAMPLGDIEVGDRVNVFGLMDVSSGQIDARIVRDLDKPASAATVQLEDLQVIGVSDASGQFVITASRTSGPCYEYVGAGRLAFPCPEGTQPAENVRGPLGSRADELRFWDDSRVYEITVPASAKVIDANRQPLNRKEIAIGDTINVYGTMKSRKASQVTAQVVRDMTRLASAGGFVIKGTGVSSPIISVGEYASMSFAVGGTSSVAPYTWSIGTKRLLYPPLGATRGLPPGMQLTTAGVINCLVAPCPEADTSNASITGTPTAAGRYIVTLQVTDASGRTAYLPLLITVAEKGSTSPKGIEVSVKTDKRTYRASDTMKVSVTATNETKQDKTISFTSSCQASYDVLPGFSLRAVQLCALGMTSVTIEAGEKKTWVFEHDIDAHLAADVATTQRFEVVGHVEGVGSSSTFVSVRPAL